MKINFRPSYYLIITALITICSFGTRAQQALTQSKALASETISMMGGMDNFNATRYIGWNFFGKRQLLWDKELNMVRVDLLKQSISITASLTDNYCVVFINGKQINEPDTLKKYLEKARIYWMNDSYWLLMPFKLFDPGVLLNYLGVGITEEGKAADILEIKFDQVGATPENKYHIYIDKETRLISQWDYYENAGDSIPSMVCPWTDYSWVGNIRLASGRGECGNITNIHVWSALPSTVFNAAAVPDFDALEQ